MSRPGDLPPAADAWPPPPPPPPPPPGLSPELPLPPQLSPPLARSGGRVLWGWAALVGAVAITGVPLGLLWALIAPDVPLVLVENGLAYAETQPEQLIAADGWFAILGALFGIGASVGGWLVARRLRGSPGLAAVILGAVLAALIAWWLGRQIGLAGYEAALAAAEPGAQLGRPADLAVAEIGWWPPRITGVLLVPATAAAAAYTMLAAWSRFPSLRGDELRGEAASRTTGEVTNSGTPPTASPPAT